MITTVALAFNLDTKAAFFLLQTKSYACLAQKLRKANHFNIVYRSPPEETELNDFLALLCQIVETFYDKANLEADEENLLLEVFKSYRSCVAETRVQNILIQDEEFLLEVRSLLRRQQNTALRFAIMQFLNNTMFLCTKAYHYFILSIFFEDILESFRRKWCLRESCRAFLSLFSMENFSLGCQDYELIIKLFQEMPEVNSLQSIIFKILTDKYFWEQFSELGVHYRISALSCVIDYGILTDLPDNSVEILVDCFINCHANFFDESDDNKQKICEAFLILKIISVLITVPEYCEVLKNNDSLLLGCTAFCGSILQLKTSTRNILPFTTDLLSIPEYFSSSFIKVFYIHLIQVINKFSEEKKQDLMVYEQQ